jgi:hypothetical protein
MIIAIEKIVIVLAYLILFYTALQIQKTDLLLGYTIGSVGLLILSAFVVNYLAKKYN